MGGTGGSSCKTASGKCDIEQVTVEAVFFLSKLNQVTSPFSFPFPYCYDAVQDISTEAKYFITVNIDSGYWQVVAEEESQEILEFFTPDRNIRCKVISVGALSSSPTFVSMMMKIQM